MKPTDNQPSNHFYPAILTDSLDVVSDQVALAKNFEGIQTVHIDVIDGFYVDNITVFPEDLTEIDFESLQLDFHLMVNEPLDFVLQTAGLDVKLPIRAMVGQVERMSSQAEFIDEVKRLDWKVGLALDLYTPLDAIDDESWKNLDVLHLMSVEAGEQGQGFVALALDKIKAARKLIAEQNLDIEIIVDGGVKLDNVKSIIEAGANAVCIGSGLWGDQDPDEVAEKIEKSV